MRRNAKSRLLVFGKLKFGRSLLLYSGDHLPTPTGIYKRHLMYICTANRHYCNKLRFKQSDHFFKII
jgi:hypothetical protein